MRLENLDIRPIGPQTGLSIFNGADYLGTYRSLHEFMLDLVYRYSIENIDEIIRKFNLALNLYTVEPYKYRGVCSEIFWPMDHMPFRYVYYCNTLSELFSRFEFHENRAQQFKDYFYYGPQGIGIHIFNPSTKKYEFWVGGNKVNTVVDVMREVKNNYLIIPSSLQEELNESRDYDVFISHKSEDFKIAEIVYSLLVKYDLKVFLSEKCLPAVANADYVAEINDALEHSRHIVVIADDCKKISSGWVKYEWSSFINEKLSGRKDGNILTLITDKMRLQDLPFSLRQYEVLNINNAHRIIEWCK